MTSSENMTSSKNMTSSEYSHITNIIQRKILEHWNTKNNPLLQGLTDMQKTYMTSKSVKKTWTPFHTRRFITYICTPESGVNMNQWLKDKKYHQVCSMFLNSDEILQNYDRPVMWPYEGMAIVFEIINEVISINSRNAARDVSRMR